MNTVHIAATLRERKQVNGGKVHEVWKVDKRSEESVGIGSVVVFGIEGGDHHGRVEGVRGWERRRVSYNVGRIEGVRGWERRWVSYNVVPDNPKDLKMLTLLVPTAYARLGWWGRLSHVLFSWSYPDTIPGPYESPV